MEYEFVAPRQIVFGVGKCAEVGTWVAGVARRAWVLPGATELVRRGLVGDILARLGEAAIPAFELPVIDHEPLVEDVTRLSNLMLEQGAAAGDCLIAVGGGSAVDLAKATAAMVGEALGWGISRAPNIVEYLEGVGTGRRLSHNPLPIVAIPTTAGAGAEATRNAVVSSKNPPFKKSLRDSRIMPQLIILDPELTLGLPPNVTAYTGMDAITQLIESYISKRWRPIPRALSVQGLKMALDALPKAVHNGQDIQARAAMSHAALLSGLALANSGLAMAHGIAPALGIHCGIPHGLACALLAPVSVRVNAEAAADAFLELVEQLYPKEEFEDGKAAALFLADKIESLCREIGIPLRLSQLGVKMEDLPTIVRGSRGTQMQYNPKDLTDEEIYRILEELL